MSNRTWFAPSGPPPPWVIAAKAARESVGVDRVAAHPPAPWSPGYRLFIRRALSAHLVATMGVTELHDETLAGWLAQEESGLKTRLWESDIASQRLIDDVTHA